MRLLYEDVTLLFEHAQEIGFQGLKHDFRKTVNTEVKSTQITDLKNPLISGKMSAGMGRGMF